MATTSGPINLAYAITALAVVVIIIATVAIPVIEDAQKSLGSESNNSGYAYKAFSSDDDITVTWLSSSSFSVNGTTYTVSSDMPVLMSDNISLAWDSTGSYLQLNDMAHTKYGHVDSDQTTFTISSGVYTLGATTDEVLGSVISLSPTGDLAAYPADSITSSNLVYLNKTSEIYAFGQDYVGLNGNYILIALSLNGTIFDLQPTGATNYTASPAANVDPASLKITFDDIEQINALAYAIDSTTFHVEYTVSDSVYTGDFKLSVFVPIEYLTLTGSASSLSSLFSVIMIMLILVPVMMAVALLRGRS